MDDTARRSRLKELERISGRRRLTVAEVSEIAAHHEALGHSAQAAAARALARRHEDPGAFAADDVAGLFGEAPPRDEAPAVVAPPPELIPPAEGPGPGRGLATLTVLLLLLTAAVVGYLLARPGGVVEEPTSLVGVPSAARLQAAEERAQVLAMVSQLQTLAGQSPDLAGYRAAVNSVASALQSYRQRQTAEVLRQPFWGHLEAALGHHRQALEVWFAAAPEPPGTLDAQALLTEPELVSRLQKQYPNAPFVYRQAGPAMGDEPGHPAGWTVLAEPLLKQIWVAAERELTAARTAGG